MRERGPSGRQGHGASFSACHAQGLSPNLWSTVFAPANGRENPASGHVARLRAAKAGFQMQGSPGALSKPGRCPQRSCRGEHIAVTSRHRDGRRFLMALRRVPKSSQHTTRHASGSRYWVVWRNHVAQSCQDWMPASAGMAISGAGTDKSVFFLRIDPRAVRQDRAARWQRRLRSSMPSAPRASIQLAKAGTRDDRPYVYRGTPQALDPRRPVSSWRPRSGRGLEIQQSHQWFAQPRPSPCKRLG